MEQHTQQDLPDIRYTILLDAPISTVWNAVATSDGLAAWFMPNDFQLVAGHRFHLAAGPYGISPCTVTRIDPPALLSFMWGKDWTLTFELKPLGGKTELTLIHSGWNAGTLTEFGQPHTGVRATMERGWFGLSQALKAYVESRG